MPTEPGEYEIRYTLRQDSEVIARRPITVGAVGASVRAPTTAIAGETLTVEWDGPDYELDYIAISRAGDTSGRYENYTYTREGSPLGLVMPTQPGEYEIRYTLRQDSEVIASVPVTVTAVTATVTAPTTAIAGDTLTVEWDGPDYELDYIAVSKAGDASGRYENFTYTREGAPLGLVMPAEPGEYEIRYVMRQDSTVVARSTVTVAPVSAALIAPDSVQAGAAFTIEWSGPDYELDFVEIVPANGRGRESFRYTRDGSPFEMTAPDTPGAFELRYTMRQDNTVIATKPLEVTE